MDCGGQVPFYLRIKINGIEIEVGGRKKEVISTFEEADVIIEKVSEAFELNQEKRVHKIKLQNANHSKSRFPSIRRTTKCGEAIVSLLSTDWGKTPRTISDLREAMEANAVFYPKTTISGVLVWLVKKEKIRRWKDQKRGYLYVLNRGGTIDQV